MTSTKNETTSMPVVSAAKPPTKPDGSNKKRPRTSIEPVEKDVVQTPISESPSVAFESPDANLGDEEKEQYREILEAMARFAERGSVIETENDTSTQQTSAEADPSKPDVSKNGAAAASDDGEKSKDASKANGTVVPKKKSRRQRKEEARGHIALLKAIAAQPDLVDAWDVTASDPLLLVSLKSWPNSVPVPGNWRHKRKYLQNKRGMEKRPFILPSYIADTGVGALRDAQIENDSKKTLKQKAREKMRAKTGRGVEIDEIVARDAFFKFQTKPRLTGHGDLYYELRELEVDAARFRPVVISSALRAALGIGPDDPPPWLINMQRYGPPPGYPGLKIPGLNAPIPRGAMFGYQVGGWGKPPVDMAGRPIYGDVFGEGLEYQTVNPKFDAAPEEKKLLWGENKVDDRFETHTTAVEKEDKADKAEVEKSESKNQENVAVPSKDDTPPPAPPPEAPSTGTIGVQLPNIEAPAGGMELRKGVPEGELYTVLKEKKRSVDKGEMYGSAHGYVIPGHETQRGDGTVNENTGIEIEDKKERKRKELGKDGERGGKRQKSFKF